MYFTFWFHWFYSFFEISSPTQQTTMSDPSVSCSQNSAKQEVIHSLKYKTMEKINPHFQHIIIDNSSNTIILKDVLAKIKNYGILEENDYNYIHELSKTRMFHFLNI